MISIISAIVFIFIVVVDQTRSIALYILERCFSTAGLSLSYWVITMNWFVIFRKQKLLYVLNVSILDPKIIDRFPLMEYIILKLMGVISNTGEQIIQVILT